MTDSKLTLAEIRDAVLRRADQVDGLRSRLESLGKEIERLLDEIDELEGVKPVRRRRKRPVEDEEALPKRRGRIPRGEGEPPARRGRPPKGEGKRRRASRPKAPRREGPSSVDVAVEILKEWGRPMAAGELAEKVEERGIVTGNTRRVILMTAGRKTSRLKKTEDGMIALPEAGETEQIPGNKD